MVVVEKKYWFQSSTIWINLVGILVVVVDLIVKTNLIPDPDVIAIIVSILNILNRFRVPKAVQPIKFI